MDVHSERSLKLVEVVWNDAWYDDNTSTRADSIEHARPFRTCTIGYLVANEKAGVMLSRDFYPSTNEFKHRHFIPSEMMVSMRYLLGE